MSLESFFADITPFLLGKRDHESTARLLYGDDPARAIDAHRLRIYGRVCAIHRQEALKFTFSHACEAIRQHAGDDAWDALVESYFFAHPMHHFELNQNGVHFTEFIAEKCAAGTLPPYLGELCDFEWWEWVTDSALDDPADGDFGPLRLHSSVEIRSYSYDFLLWIDDDRKKSPAPEPGDSMVLFWRDKELNRRRERATRLELMIIKAIFESLSLDAELAARIGVTADDLFETVADLREAGILIGENPAAAG